MKTTKTRTKKRVPIKQRYIFISVKDFRNELVKTIYSDQMENYQLDQERVTNIKWLYVIR